MKSLFLDIEQNAAQDQKMSGALQIVSGFRRTPLCRRWLQPSPWAEGTEVGTQSQGGGWNS